MVLKKTLALLHKYAVLKLYKISQISFAEYHSKRNFVECVHADEICVLPKHRPFGSQKVNQRPLTGRMSIGRTWHVKQNLYS